MKLGSGFTIIELMIAVALLAVAVTIGVPSFQSLMERNQLASSNNSFLSSLMLARSEAVKRKQRVTVCASADGIACNGASYEDGWIVVMNDEAASANPPADSILWQHEGLPSSLTLRGRGNYATQITFTPVGRVAGINGRFTLCKDDQIDKARVLQFLTSGRMHQGKIGPDGVPLENDNSTPITACV